MFLELHAIYYVNDIRFGGGHGLSKSEVKRKGVLFTVFGYFLLILLLVRLLLVEIINLTRILLLGLLTANRILDITLLGAQSEVVSSPLGHVSSAS